MTRNIAKSDTPDARAVQALFRVLREEVEESDGSWPGGDVVEVLCEWFKLHGFDVDGPNPYATDDDPNDYVL
jgi:hypothetical protein